MSGTEQRIDCGDTTHCNECIHKDNRADHETDHVKSLVMNGLGRCDFYDGPNKVYHHTAN